MIAVPDQLRGVETQRLAAGAEGEQLLLDLLAQLSVQRRDTRQHDRGPEDDTTQHCNSAWWVASYHTAAPEPPQRARVTE